MYFVDADNEFKIRKIWNYIITCEKESMPPSISDIAEHIQRKHPVVSGFINELEKAGFVKIKERGKTKIVLPNHDNEDKFNNLLDKLEKALFSEFNGKSTEKAEVSQ